MALPAGAAQLWEDGGVTLYDRAGRAVQTLDVHRAAVRDVLVAPTGDWAATAGNDATIVLWDIDPATGQWSRRETLTGHTGEIAGIELDPTGRTLYSAATDGRLIAWDVTADAGFGSSYPGLGDRWIANRPQLVGHDDLLVAPTRPVSRSSGGGGVEAAGAGCRQRVRNVPRCGDGRVVDEVPVGPTLDGRVRHGGGRQPRRAPGRGDVWLRHDRARHPEPARCSARSSCPRWGGGRGRGRTAPEHPSPRGAPGGRRTARGCSSASRQDGRVTGVWSSWTPPPGR